MANPFATEYVFLYFTFLTLFRILLSPLSFLSSVWPLWFILWRLCMLGWGWSDGGPARGHVRISSQTSKNKKKKNTHCLPPTSLSSYLHLPLQVKRNDLMRGPVTAGNGVGGWVRRLFPSAGGGCEGLMGVIETPRMSGVCSLDRRRPLVLSSPQSQETHIYTKHTPHFSNVNLAVELVLTPFEL